MNIIEALRDQYREETKKVVRVDIAAYADWLELRFIHDPEEIALLKTITALDKASNEIDTGIQLLKDIKRNTESAPL